MALSDRWLMSNQREFKGLQNFAMSVLCFSIGFACMAIVAYIFIEHLSMSMGNGEAIGAFMFVFFVPSLVLPIYLSKYCFERVFDIKININQF